MYKRRREQGDLVNHGHNESKKEGLAEGDSQQPNLARGPMREPTHRGAGCSSVSWQPRSYECQFCKRGFSSAQALGGHMNVHRRDRALSKAGFHGSAASYHRNNSNSINHVSALQPRGHVGKTRASFFIGSGTSIYIPYDQVSAAAAAAPQPSSFFTHVAARDNKESHRPGLCIECSSKTTQIIDQPNFRMECHKSAVTDDDGELDLELRLGEKP